jgi:hypothetical protein
MLMVETHFEPLRSLCSTFLRPLSHSLKFPIYTIMLCTVKIPELCNKPVERSKNSATDFGRISSDSAEVRPMAFWLKKEEIRQF